MLLGRVSCQTQAAVLHDICFSGRRGRRMHFHKNRLWQKAKCSSLPLLPVEEILSGRRSRTGREGLSRKCFCMYCQCLNQSVDPAL